MPEVVIKVGGSVMDALPQAFFAQIAQARTERGVVLVHGAGNRISALLPRLGLVPEFRGGLRVTSPAALEVAEMVLSGAVNKELVERLAREGCPAVGLSGADGGLIAVRPLPELGQVGHPERVDPAALRALLAAGFTPVVSPISNDAAGLRHNVNADAAAAALAAALGAPLVLVSNVPGVLDAGGELLPLLTPSDVERLIEAGTVSGGMVPKVTAALECLERGVPEVSIVDGASGALGRLLAGGAAGTRFVSEPQAK